MPLDDATVAALLEARVGDPGSVLGIHEESPGVFTCRTLVSGADAVACIPIIDDRRGKPVKLHARAPGLWEGPLPGITAACDWRLAVFRAGQMTEERDPYSFWPLIADFDLDLFRAGNHLHLGDILGAHPVLVDGCTGTRFAVWAPTATRVSVVGSWNGFDGRWHPMRHRGPSGVWELFIPGVGPGALYKFEIRAASGELRLKVDPFAWQSEAPPATASIVAAPDRFAWQDAPWIARRQALGQLDGPMSIYEVHLGSWMRGATGPAGETSEVWPNYRTIAKRLVPYVKRLGFTHIEFLPLAGHPFEGSWGYQVTGQYAPNSLHGGPDDLRALIDECHAAGLGVLIDFVPAHFPKDDWSLARFDGSPCYEYADPREGEHLTWGTCVYNFRRPEVRNFLLAAALHWCRRFHIDGLRVDAVSSMLYRNYDRNDGGWIPNEKGGNSNEEAKTFLQELTTTVRRECPGVVLIAEESTSWAGVTAPTTMEGLGFDLKWNMGWMHDTLSFLALDPMWRRGSHERITFHQWYAYDERWVLPLSHDEVVHGKRSLIDKAPGDWWQRRASLRLMLGYQVAVPGRPLLFQGGEFGQGREWAWDRSLDWDEAAQPERKGISDFLAVALGLYRSQPSLYTRDDHRDGFRWVVQDDRESTVVAWLRRANGHPDILVIVNFTPVPRPGYLLGVSRTGDWSVLVSSDESRFGGSGWQPLAPLIPAHGEPHHGHPARLIMDVPPLAIVFLRAPFETGAVEPPPAKPENKPAAKATSRGVRKVKP